jgi:hypothetical protein
MTNKHETFQTEAAEYEKHNQPEAKPDNRVLIYFFGFGSGVITTIAVGLCILEKLMES